MPWQLPEIGEASQTNHLKGTAGFGHLSANIHVVIMLVKISDRELRKDWLPELYFLVITVVPWAVLFWLVWPRG